MYVVLFDVLCCLFVFVFVLFVCLLLFFFVVVFFVCLFFLFLAGAQFFPETLILGSRKYHNISSS